MVDSRLSLKILAIRLCRFVDTWVIVRKAKKSGINITDSNPFVFLHVQTACSEIKILTVVKVNTLSDITYRSCRSAEVCFI